MTPANTILAVTVFILAAVVAGSSFGRYDIVTSAEGRAIHRVDRLTGRVETCNLPTLRRMRGSDEWRRVTRGAAGFQPRWCVGYFDPYYQRPEEASEIGP